MTTRPMRKDAQRNHDTLLSCADAVFRERGADAPLEDVARAAGVGVGTLYRHFPSRDALLEALVRERWEAIRAHGAALEDADDPLAALTEWLYDLGENSRAYRGLTDAVLGALGDASSDLHAACTLMRESGNRLLARAQRAGAVRADVTGREMYTLVHGAIWAGQRIYPDDGTTTPDRRLVDLVVAGLRTRP